MVARGSTLSSRWDASGYSRGVAAQHDPPDEVLVERTLNGDKEAFGLLAERYFRMISVLAYQKTGHRSDAEDIVQEAFVRAFRALPSLREGRKFASWIYNITLKLCIDWGRRRERLRADLPRQPRGRHRRRAPAPARCGSCSTAPGGTAMTRCSPACSRG